MIGTQVGSYRVVATLGGGGVADVYRVQHTVLETWHAMKVLKVPTDSARRRLIAEGRIQARLRHRNVVCVTDVLEVGGAPALLLELVEGPTLGALLAAGLRSPDLVEALGAGVLSGVAAAHELGLVHRDLKPGNVLIAVEDGQLVPKVTDFGLARGLDDDDARLTRSGASLGTPLYMAPEQVRDARSVDRRTDVWSCGALLYELCTGQVPFDDTGDRLELFRRIDEATPRPLRELRPDAPDAWVVTVEAALQRAPDARPADAGALLDLWGRDHPPATVDGDLEALMASLAPTDAHSGDVAAPQPTFGLTLDEAPGGDTTTEEAPAPAPVSLPATRDALTTLPEVALPATSAPPWPWLVAGGLGVVMAGGLGWWWGASQPPVPLPPEAAVGVAEPAVEAAIDPLADNRRRIYHKALDALLEGDAAGAEEQVQYIVAGAPDEAPALLLAASHWLDGDRGRTWEELGRGAPWQEDGSVAGALLHGMVAPARAEGRATDVSGQVLALLALPRPVGTVAALEAPGRALPLLVEAQLARRGGDLDAAASALSRGRELASPTPLWHVEEGLVAWARGDDVAAARHLDAAVEGRYAPTRAWVARAQLDLALERPVQAAASAEALSRRGAHAAAARHVALADVHAAAGRRAEALEALQAAEAGLERYGRDGGVGWARVEVQTEVLRLAVAWGDAAAAREAATRLAALAEGPVVAWAKPEAQRRAGAAQALVAWVRGEEAPAQQALAALPETEPPVVVQQLLRDALAGDLLGRIHPALLP